MSGLDGLGWPTDDLPETTMNTPHHTWSDSPIHEQIRNIKTDTPETDAMVSADQHHLEDDNFFSASVYWRICDLARGLERERDEAREVLRQIRDNEVNPEDEADRFLRDHVPSELSKVREQRDRLAENMKTQTNTDAPIMEDYPSTPCSAFLILWHGMDDWEWIEGDLCRAHEQATMERRHLNYGRKGYSIIPCQTRPVALLQTPEWAYNNTIEALQSLTQPKKYDANEHQSFYP